MMRNRNQTQQQHLMMTTQMVMAVAIVMQESSTQKGVQAGLYVPEEMQLAGDGGVLLLLLLVRGQAEAGVEQQLAAAELRVHVEQHAAEATAGKACRVGLLPLLLAELQVVQQ
jgi:hypothetical protein